MRVRLAHLVLTFVGHLARVTLLCLARDSSPCRILSGITVVLPFFPPAYPASSANEKCSRPPGIIPDATAVEESLTLSQELLRRRMFKKAACVLENVLVSDENQPLALLHLAEVYHNTGRTPEAIDLLERLLGLGLKAGATSFVMNRRGIYLASRRDFGGARTSYELALEKARNRHANYNLAVLLHRSIFPETSDFSLLLQAIELYRAALGKDAPPVPGECAPLSATDQRRSSAASVCSSSNEEAGVLHPNDPDYAMSTNTTSTGVKTPGALSPTGMSGSAVQCPPGADHPRKRGDVRGKPAVDQHEVGGPVDTVGVTRHLALALVEAGRAGEAVRELEAAIWCRWGKRLDDGTSTIGSPQASTDREFAVDDSARAEEALVWASLASARTDAGHAHGAVEAGETVRMMR